jgi:hypothetical protein
MARRVVGMRVEVWWPGDEAYYRGRVTAFNAGELKQHGTAQRTTPLLTLSSPLRYHSCNRLRSDRQAHCALR